MRKKIWLVVLVMFLVVVGGYLYSENSKQKAVEDAMQQAVDACSTGNRLLLDEKIVQAHSVFRERLSTMDAYDTENRLHNRLVYLGCKKY